MNDDPIIRAMYLLECASESMSSEDLFSLIAGAHYLIQKSHTDCEPSNYDEVVKLADAVAKAQTAN